MKLLQCQLYSKLMSFSTVLSVEADTNTASFMSSCMTSSSCGMGNGKKANAHAGLSTCEPL